MRKLILIVSVLLGAILALQYGHTLVASRGADDGPELPVVRASRATLALSTVATGSVKSKVGAEVKVGSQISGVVAKLNVGIGDKVAKGQVLATLEDAAYQARARTLAAELDAAMAEQRFAQAELQRFEQLGPNITKIQLENSRRNVAVREAMIAQTGARLAEARVQLGQARIVAPISGTIASVSTYEGETVAANFAAPTFVTIVDLDRLEIQAYVDENDIGRVQIGQAVSVRADAYQGRALPGVVRAIYPKAQLNNNVVNYVVIVDIAQRQGLLLRPEMTAHVTFILDQRDNALSVPRAAVLKEQHKEFVIVKGPTGWVKKAVSTGLRTAQRIEITGNLRENEEIVADAQLWKDKQKGALQ